MDFLHTQSVSVEKLPIGVCILGKEPSYKWDVVMETNYRQISKYELVDSGYPKGGFNLDIFKEGDKRIRFSQPQDIRFVCFYYKTTGEIIDIIHYDGLVHLRKLRLGFKVN